METNSVVRSNFTTNNDTVVIGNNSKQEYDAHLFAQKRIIYTKPKGYIKDNNIDDYKKQKRLRNTFGMATEPWTSVDGEVLFYWQNYPIRTKEFQKSALYKALSKRKESIVDKQHCYQTKEMFRSYYGKKITSSYRDSLTFYSQKEAKLKFNADTVYRFSIRLRPEDFYKKKYKTVEVIFLQKKGCGWVNLICFYTDKGKKRINRYRKQIEAVFKYKK